MFIRDGSLWVKNTFFYLLVASLFFPASKLNASHIFSVDITYDLVTPGTYLINVRMYRDCEGIPMPLQIKICYSSTSCGVSDSFTLSQQGPPFQLPPSPYLPPVITTCNGGTGYGIERYIYQGLLVLPDTCADWVLSYSSWPHAAINGFPWGNSYYFNVSTKIDNLNYPDNSSVQYDTDPTTVFCIGQPAWNIFSATDSDGDSLAYHLIPFFNDTAVCPPQPYQLPGLNYQLQSSTPILIDSITGIMTFTPINIQIAFSSVKVEEFRNNVMINESTIEFFVNVVSGCIISGDYNLSINPVSIYPNPSSNSISISIPADEVLKSVTAIDLAGRKNQIYSIQEPGNHTKLNLNTLREGIYILELVTDKRKLYQKVVKSTNN
jgi:hypothetical protein